MGATAGVTNGELLNNGITAAKAQEKAKTSGVAGGTLDKNAFLQLLVAQMKYQDPLEPTDNTEYVSQLANFSELEEMQNISNTSEKQSAAALVGKYVSIDDTGAEGSGKMIEGFVDSVIYSGGKTYLQLNEKLYEYDKLDTVYDDAYVAAMLVKQANEAKENGETKQE